MPFSGYQFYTTLMFSSAKARSLVGGILELILLLLPLFVSLGLLLSLAVNVSHHTLALILVAVVFYTLVILSDRLLICCKYYEVRLFGLNVAGLASYAILAASLLDPFFTTNHSLLIVNNVSNLSNASSTVIAWSGLQISYIVFVVAVLLCQWCISFALCKWCTSSLELEQISPGTTV